MSEPPLNQKKFLEKVKDVPNILIGNGFSLSHPVFGECFSFSIEDILSELEKGAIVFEMSKFYNREQSTCPESFLRGAKIELVELIVKSYIKKFYSCLKDIPDKQDDKIYFSKFDEISFSNLFNLYKGIKGAHSCNMLKGFSNIFTLNYDPIIYFEILKCCDDRVKFFDGFVSKNDQGYDGCLQKHSDKEEQSDFLKQEYIECKLNNSRDKRIFYLHGSWFIQCDFSNSEEKLRKISFGNYGEEWTLSDLFNWSEKKLPYLVFEDRWQTKKGFLDDKKKPYLNYCYNELKEIEGELLIFGVSFNNDDHILEALEENKKLENIYITHCGENHPNAGKIERFLNEDRREFLPVEKDVIWEKDSLLKQQAESF
jgi:hypothetical protein